LCVGSMQLSFLFYWTFIAKSWLYIWVESLDLAFWTMLELFRHWGLLDLV
jgi:hypothetical protein